MKVIIDFFCSQDQSAAAGNTGAQNMRNSGRDQADQRVPSGRDDPPDIRRNHQLAGHLATSRVRYHSLRSLADASQRDAGQWL